MSVNVISGRTACRTYFFEREDGPAIGDCPEIVVLDGGEHAVVQELGTDNGITTNLSRSALAVEDRVVPVAV